MALTEFVVDGNKLYEIVGGGGENDVGDDDPAAASAGFKLKSIRLLTRYGHPDADALTILLSEAVVRGQSCLVFCSTRSRAVDKASDLATKLAK